MRSLTVAIVGSLILVVQCQLNACGQTCLNNMLAQAAQLGCASTDDACICSNVDFADGLRDCANEACGSEEAQILLAYGQSICSSVLASSTAAQSTLSSLTNSGTTTMTAATSSQEGAIPGSGSNSGTTTMTAATSSQEGAIPGSGSNSGTTTMTAATSSQEGAIPGSGSNSGTTTMTAATSSQERAIPGSGSNPGGTSQISSHVSSPSSTPSESAEVNQSSTLNSATSAMTSSTLSSVPTGAGISSNGGLTSGAKAGIGIGVALIVLIALLLALYFFMKRKKDSTDREGQDLETAELSATQRRHEMMTFANTHEMDGKQPNDFNVKEPGLYAPQGTTEQKMHDLNFVPPTASTNLRAVAEMDASRNDQNEIMRTELDHLQARELDASATIPQRAVFHSPPRNSIATLRKAVAIQAPVTRKSSVTNPETETEPKPLEQSPRSESTSSPSSPTHPEDKLRALKERMQRVREDKERLQRIQALKELEDEIQAELLLEEKNLAGP